MTEVRRLGIDVGGTKCLGVVLDADGRVIEERREPTPEGPAALLDTLAELAQSFAPFDHVGIGVPGLVTRAGVVCASPNLFGINHFRVGELLSERLGTTVHVDNDATCAAAAEWAVGIGRGTVDFVMITLGTGIGGGLVSGGRLARGRNGFGGEIGHMVVDPGGPLCPCGQRGCWERFASGSGLARLAREAASEERLRGVVARAGGDVEQIRGEHVQAAALEGDAEALEVIDSFGRWVALGLVNLTNILDPEMLVLGGGLAQSPDLYVGSIRRWFGELLYSAELRPHPQIEFARLGPQAGAVGAALLHDLH